jgi:hypothetical protein
MLVLPVIGLLGCVAASGDDGTSAEVTGGRPAFPQVTDHGGGTIATPQVQPVVWQGDEALGDRFVAFGTWMFGRQDYWGTLAEYGVNPGSVLPTVVIPGPSPASLSSDDISTLIDSLVTAGTLPTVDANTVVSVLTAAGVPVKDGCLTSCKQFSGYHAATAGGVAYTVHPQCNTGVLDTRSVSHELAEAATDPWINKAAPAWKADLSLGEIGDLCNVSGGITLSGGDGTSYLVERLFSAKTAAGPQGDPCLPAPATPYFNVAIQPLVVQVSVDAAGRGKGSLTLNAFADQNIGSISWQLQTADWQHSPFLFDVPFDMPTPQLVGRSRAGDSQKVTFTLNGATRSSYTLYAISKAQGQTQTWMADVQLAGGAAQVPGSTCDAP